MRRHTRSRETCSWTEDTAAHDHDVDDSWPVIGSTGRQDSGMCRRDRPMSRHMCRSHHTARLGTALYTHDDTLNHDSVAFQGNSYFYIIHYTVT